MYLLVIRFRANDRDEIRIKIALSTAEEFPLTVTRLKPLEHQDTESPKNPALYLLSDD